MLKFLFSRFISKDRALDMLGEHEEKITEFSRKNKHLSSAVKTGFKLWSIWKCILMLWYGFLFLLLIGGGYIIYLIVSKFI